VFCGIFIAEEADGVADKGQVIPQQLMYRHSKCFLNMSLRSTCFNDKAFFSGKKQNFQSLDYCPQMPDYQDFQIIRSLKNAQSHIMTSLSTCKVPAGIYIPGFCQVHPTFNFSPRGLTIIKKPYKSAY
jgi:hypothetical protein